MTSDIPCLDFNGRPFVPTAADPAPPLGPGRYGKHYNPPLAVSRLAADLALLKAGAVIVSVATGADGSVSVLVDVP